MGGVTVSLPDATRSDRVYPLLQNLDLENLAFATVQGVGHPLNIEELNEDALRRLVLVNLARLTVAGEWNGLLTAASSGGGGMPIFPNVNPPGEGGNIVSYPLGFPTSSGDTNSNGVLNSNTTTAMFYPFYSFKGGEIQSLTCGLIGTTDDDVLVNVYSSDDAGLPASTIGSEATWDMGTAGTVTLDVSGLTTTWTLDEGTIYWLALMLKTSADARPNFRIHDIDEGNPFVMPVNTQSTGLYNGGRTHLYITGLSGALPSTITTANLTSTGAPYAYYLPYITFVL